MSLCSDRRYLFQPQPCEPFRFPKLDRVWSSEGEEKPPAVTSGRQVRPLSFGAMFAQVTCLHRCPAKHRPGPWAPSRGPYPSSQSSTTSLNKTTTNHQTTQTNIAHFTSSHEIQLATYLPATHRQTAQHVPGSFRQGRRRLQEADGQARPGRPARPLRYEPAFTFACLFNVVFKDPLSNPHPRSGLYKVANGEDFSKAPAPGTFDFKVRAGSRSLPVLFRCDVMSRAQAVN